MKKFLLLSSIIFFTSSVFSQSIVSTNPENRNAILEEFTGINCQFCPDGHAIANSIKASNPDDFFVINVHSGGFANPGAGQPDFRTAFGAAIDNQANVAGYPAGTINRTVFPSFSQNPGGTAMSRGNWGNAAGQIIAQSSYVNVGVEAEIDVNTNIITVHVEAYYTADSPQGTNKLNVALLQNNTLGPQVGGDMGDEYVHMHRLVHMITGQWGEDITTTTQGSFIDETYTYTIPSDYNGVQADVFNAQFEVVAFMAESQQNIISGDGAFATYTGLANNNDARIKSVDAFGELCDGSVAPTVEIQNMGNNDITTLDIQYAVNGEAPQVYTWTGNLSSVDFEEVQLPEVFFSLQPTNQVVISLPTDDDISNNSNTSNASSVEVFVTNQVDLTLVLDDYPGETVWGILDSSGGIIQQGGPYNGQPNQTIQASISLPNDDCYEFVILDSFGDGICCAFGNGSYTLETQSGDVIVTGGQFGSRDDKNFSNFDVLSSNEFVLNEFKLFPNPSSGLISMSANENFNYEIFDIQGRGILSGQSDALTKELNLSEFSSGVYLVKVSVGKISKTHKLILK